MKFPRISSLGFGPLATKSKSINCMLVAVALMGTSILVATSPALSRERTPDRLESVPGQYVVSLKKARNQYDARKLELALKARVIDQIRPDMLLIQRANNESMDAAIKSLRESGVVTLVDPNYIYRANRLPNDPDLKKLWGLKNSGEADKEGTIGMTGVDIGAERAWDITTGSKDVIVAVIDTGVDFKHPDLMNNAWVNQAEKDGQPGVDDDGNGYVDDIHGFNFVSNKGDSTDDNGHGSHCSGTIGAEGDNGNAIVGVNWNVSIMALKFLDSNGSGSLANAVKAIDYARKMGATLTSNSWGGGGAAQNLKKAIEDSRDAGQLFVAAAGNDGTDNDTRPSYPASFPVDNILSVAAIDNRGDMAYFTNFGLKTVHIAAPGVNVYSAVPGGFDSYSGTSMAAPHVSGVAALLLAKNPDYTYTELKERMMKHARPLRALNGKTVSGGVVDAYYALSGETPPADPNDPSSWTNKIAQQVSTPHPYPASYNQSFTITVPGAKRVAVHFKRFETENYYDKVQFLNAQGKVFGTWSGKRDGQISPIVDGDTVVVKMTSDTVVHAYGFDIDEVVFEPATADPVPAPQQPVPPTQPEPAPQQPSQPAPQVPAE